MMPGENIGKGIVWALNIIWTIIAALIILAPYLAGKGSSLAGVIYLLFKPTCHQMASRSFFVWGHQFAVCARCTGIWFSLMIFGYATTAVLHLKRFPPLKFGWLIVAILPLAIDGVIQLVRLHESNNIVRIITGSVAGAALIWFLYPRIWNVDNGGSPTKSS